MALRRGRAPASSAFEIVRAAGSALPGIEDSVRYDGAHVLKVNGVFMAGLATHESAEPGTLVVRIDIEERQWLLDEAPDTYYVTDYYRPHPVVLVRLSRIDAGALRDLLTMSWRLTTSKTKARRSRTLTDSAVGVTRPAIPMADSSRRSRRSSRSRPGS